MKQRNAQTRLICCLSVVGLSLAACSQKATQVRPTPPPQAASQITPEEPAGASSRLFHYSKKGLRQVKIKDTRSTKRVQYEYANLWERLFDSYSLPDVRNQAVEREVAWFVNHPTYLQRAQQRAEPFLYNIVQQIERQGVPGEIALLPVVESAFQAQAVSPAKAAGIWQFIPATGRHYGLRQNHAYDGRRDVYASTKAAIKYLKKLNRQFDGDWLLAIAAYNCGEGAVERAIRRNAYSGLATDFWSLDLPQETRSYVPRLLAVSRLMSDADQYGVDLLHIPNQAQYKPVKVSHSLDLAMAADAADMSLEQFRALNPGFKNSVVDPEGSVRLFVPASKSKTFKKELARLASAQGDLLSREFERARETAGTIASAEPDTTAARVTQYVPPTPRRPEPASNWSSRPEPTDVDSIPTVSPPTRPSAEVAAVEEPAPAVRAAAYAGAATSAYAYSDGIDNPFQGSSLAGESEPDLGLADEPRHKTQRKARSEHGHARSNQASAHGGQLLKKNSHASNEQKGSERSARSQSGRGAAVSYRYSEQPKSSARLGSGKGKNSENKGTGRSAAAGAKPDRNGAKLTLAMANPGMARGTSAARPKTRESTTVVASPSSRKADQKKNERIVTAKADVAKSKSRR